MALLSFSYTKEHYESPSCVFGGGRRGGRDLILKVTPATRVLQKTSQQTRFRQTPSPTRLPSKLVVVDRKSMKHLFRRIHCF